MQLTVLNATPQKRRIFIHTEKPDSLAVNSIIFGAWQRYLLAPGEPAYTAYGSYQLTARSLLASAQHQTVQVEAPLGSGWAFELDANNAPALVPRIDGQPSNISYANLSQGHITVGIHNNYAQLVPDQDVGPGVNYTRSPTHKLFFYVSVAVTDALQPIVFEPYIGEMALAAGEMHAQFVQDEGVFRWEFVSKS